MSRYPHGTYSNYTVGKCRCPECRAASTTYARERYRQQAYGRWKPWADADDVRAHLRNLHRHIAYDTVADLAGVPRRAIWAILYGQKGKPQPTRVRTTTAQKLYAVTADLDRLPGHVRITAVGSSRRLQALAVRGWSSRQVSERMGVPRWQVERLLTDAVIVAVEQARAVRAVTARLFDQDPPQTTRAERHSVSLVRNRAKRNGWVPLAAWDDIDDPDAVPDLGLHTPRSYAVAENAEELERQGLTPEQVAERLGIKRDSIGRAKRRAREQVPA